MDNESAASHEHLRVIAGLLGIATDRFFEPTTIPSREDTIELNSLWHRLRTSEGRAAALDALKTILDNEIA